MTAIRIRIGGLMRCCIQSLDQEAPLDPQEGETFHCLYCSDEYGMRFRDDAWEWAGGTA